MWQVRLKGILVVSLTLSTLMLLAPGVSAGWVNVFGFLVVMGGTLLAVLMSRPVPLVIGVLQRIPELLKTQPATASTSRDIEQLLKLAQPFRHGQLRDVEQVIPNLRHPLLRKGFLQLIDRCSADDLRHVLQLEIARTVALPREQAKILRSMASFAPAFGMLGTLLGLIHMLHGLGDQGLDQLGPAMGFALMTTLFGLLAANLFFKPLAIKLERQLDEQMSIMRMLLEGLLMVHAGRHPLLIKERLESYVIAEPGIQSVQQSKSSRSVLNWRKAYAD